MRSAGAAVHGVFSLRLNVTAGVAGLALEQGNRVRFTLARVVFTVNVATSTIQTLYAESLEGDMRHFFNSVVLPHFNNHIKGISIPFNMANPFSSVLNGTVSLWLDGAACDSIAAFSVRNISQWNYSDRSVSCLVVQLF
ncbi:hypothetical protein ERJ75_000852900 [Trypanosoma vivax]|nr:hypothetical protein ERJ75_000852900 [Trypanosoma vivax]